MQRAKRQLCTWFRLHLISVLLGGLSLFMTGGCVTSVVATHGGLTSNGSLVFGRVLVVLTGPTTRWYQPSVRFFELVNRETRERLRVDVESSNRIFTLALPPGSYELSRIQINEGPFMSISDLALSFHVAPDRLTYAGTWRLGVDSPRYGRMVVVSAVEDDADRENALAELVRQHPDLSDRSVATSLLEPPTVQIRLYEVASYPRVPRYFRRHFW